MSVDAQTNAPMNAQGDAQASGRLLSRLRELDRQPMPLPGGGRTPERHRLLMQVAREDLSLARLAEAHWDAVSILYEAGRTPYPGALYGIWASEVSGKNLGVQGAEKSSSIRGTKPFCSGAGLLDRALVTVQTPEHRLIDADLRADPACLSVDGSSWHTPAFAATGTATVIFRDLPVRDADFVGPPGWYLHRPGFWHGACGPAACWAGGAAGLFDDALHQSRSDPHTTAHLGAMRSAVWALEAMLDAAGREIDLDPGDRKAAQIRALTLRHLIESVATDVIRRFARAYGPAPLAFQPETGRRYLELDLYLRQSHAERDLEVLGALVRA